MHAWDMAAERAAMSRASFHLVAGLFDDASVQLGRDRVDRPGDLGVGPERTTCDTDKYAFGARQLWPGSTRKDRT